MRQGASASRNATRRKRRLRRVAKPKRYVLRCASERGSHKIGRIYVSVRFKDTIDATLRRRARRGTPERPRKGLPRKINAYAINGMTHDPKKRKTNQRKHEIDLAECEPIFDEPMLTQEDTRAGYDEQRFVSLGLLKGRVVMLVWTDREGGPRMISCRKAEPHEQKIYYRTYPKS